MKTIKLLSALLLVVTFSTFAQKSDIKVNQSTVKWTGNKIGGSHNGEIKVKDGYFEFKGENIVGGKVVIDMSTITNIDLDDAGYNQKLVGHLKSDDFFGVETYPTSTFKLSKASKFKNNKATISGVLTIKDKSQNVSIEVTRKDKVYTSQLKVDRSKYGVRYGSNSFFDNLGDKAIDDIFILDFKFVL